MDEKTLNAMMISMMKERMKAIEARLEKKLKDRVKLLQEEITKEVEEKLLQELERAKHLILRLKIQEFKLARRQQKVIPDELFIVTVMTTATLLRQKINFLRNI